MMINDNYKIEADGMNITVYQRAKSAGAKTAWRAEAFFSTFESALKYLVDQEVTGTGLKDLESVVKTQAALYDLIKQLGQGQDAAQQRRAPRKLYLRGVGHAA